MEYHPDDILSYRNMHGCIFKLFIVNYRLLLRHKFRVYFYSSASVICCCVLSVVVVGRYGIGNRDEITFIKRLKPK